MTWRLFSASHYLNQCWIIINCTLGKNSSEIWIKIKQFSCKKIRLKMSFAKWRPFCLGLNQMEKRISPNLVPTLWDRLDTTDTWWRHQMETFPRHCPFLRRIHRSPVDSPHKGQWRRALMISLSCAWTNGWANRRNAGDLRRHRTHYAVTVMIIQQQDGCAIGHVPWRALLGLLFWYPISLVKSPQLVWWSGTRSLGEL